MVYLIYGSPCSGKSTYIKEHFKPGDIICDIDYLYSAISLDIPHGTELYAQEVARELHNTLLDIIRDRKGHWRNAYVVCTANTNEKIKNLKERINADEIIFIDTPYEKCAQRVKQRPPYFIWLIQEWFMTKDNEQDITIDRTIVKQNDKEN